MIPKISSAWVAFSIFLCIACTPAARALTLVAHPFNGSQEVNTSQPENNYFPHSKLLLGPDDAFYGTATYGGANSSSDSPTGNGFIFRVSDSGIPSIIYSFKNGDDGRNPIGALAIGPDGETMYGTSGNGLNDNGVIYSVTTTGSFSKVFEFSNAIDAGSVPNGGLVLGPDGQTFYGTTQYGGVNQEGEIYSVTTGGSNIRLKSFATLSSSNTNTDGAQPTSGLTLGDDGNLYGVTSQGGASGNGTIFCITTSGSLTTLHTFSSGTAPALNDDGMMPVGELFKGPAGVFYGVAEFGGEHGFGVVYSITTSGSFTVQYAFTSVDGAAYPVDVTAGPAGSFWGMSRGGGAGFGAVWELRGRALTVIALRANGFGDIVNSGLLLGPDGNLYGTTSSYGLENQGTFLKVALNGASIGPYSSAAGRYYGNFDDLEGYVGATLKPDGAITAVIVTGSGRAVVRGSLSASGSFAASAARGTTIGMQLIPPQSSGGYIFQGSADGNTFPAYRAAADSGEIGVAEGTYSVVLKSALSSGPLYGEALATVDHAGVVSMAGHWPDYSPLRTTGLLLRFGASTYLYDYYNKPDQAGFWFIDTEPATQFSGGNGEYSVPPKTNPYFPLGFNYGTNITGANYIAPPRGQGALTSGTYAATLRGGGLVANTVDLPVTVTAAGAIVVIGANTIHLRLLVNQARGTVAGSFDGIFAGSTRPMLAPVGGIVVQSGDPAYIVGGFLGPVSTGTNGVGVFTLTQ